MINTLRIRLVVSTLAIAFLGTACESAMTAGGNDDCTVTPDYKISCPAPTTDLSIKSN